MSDGFPSMTALLGLLAVAGYQNRDKLAELLHGGGHPGPSPSGVGPAPPAVPTAGTPAGGGGGLSGVLGQFAGHDPGSFLGSGIGDLLDRFSQAGHGETAQSWVSPGPNRPLAPQQLEQSIGPETLASLTQQTGLSRDELLARLSRELPTAVDHYTPDGRLPNRS